MEESIDAKRYVDTQAQLAEQLGVSTRTVIRMTKLATSPGKTPQGKYDVTEWSRFREEYNENVAAVTSFPKEIKEKIAKVRLKRETAQAEREMLLLKKLKGEVVPCEAVTTSWRTYFAKLQNVLRNELQSVPEISIARADQLFNDILDQITEMVRRDYGPKDQEAMEE